MLSTPQKLFRCSAMVIASYFSLAANESTAATDPAGGFLDSVEQSLEKDIVDVWYPRVIDAEYGGFLTNFDAQWDSGEHQQKGVVAQSRHIWTCARLSERYPDKPYLREAAIEGSRFLLEHFWDDEHGGFYWLTDRQGNIVIEEGGPIRKLVYGNAFAIYALAAVYDVTGELFALQGAKRGFQWLEAHAHDEENWGYFNTLTVQGDPIWGTKANDYAKGQNTTIHLLEAFTELYKIWPDEQVKLRIEELKDLLLELIIDPRGYLVQFFDETWMPISFENLAREQYAKVAFWDHVSFGHDVETAYLLWEADHVTAGGDEARVLEMGKRMLDHAIENGWDTETGSIPDGGFYFPGEEECTIVRPERTWWAQAEVFNALLMFGTLYPEDTHDYLGKARQSWEYIQSYLVDSENGGWYEHGIDLNPECEEWPKSHIWKAAYHNSRALMNAREWHGE